MLCGVGYRPNGEKARGVGQAGRDGDGDGGQGLGRGGARMRREELDWHANGGGAADQLGRARGSGASRDRVVTRFPGRGRSSLLLARAPTRFPLLNWCCLLLPRSFCFSCARGCCCCLLALAPLPAVLGKPRRQRPWQVDFTALAAVLGSAR